MDNMQISMLTEMHWCTIAKLSNKMFFKKPNASQHLMQFSEHPKAWAASMSIWVESPPICLCCSSHKTHSWMALGQKLEHKQLKNGLSEFSPIMWALVRFERSIWANFWRRAMESDLTCLSSWQSDLTTADKRLCGGKKALELTSL